MAGPIGGAVGSRGGDAEAVSREEVGEEGEVIGVVYGGWIGRCGRNLTGREGCGHVGSRATEREGYDERGTNERC